MGKDEIEEAETLLMSDYLEQKIFAEISLPSRKALSNLREKEIIFTALNNSPSSRELMASLMAAGLDVSAAKGAKAPQVTLTVNSVMTEGDLASASKSRGSPGATIQATYVLYDWGRLDANVKGRKEV